MLRDEDQSALKINRSDKLIAPTLQGENKETADVCMCDAAV